MENVTTGHKTVLEQKDLQIDVPIDDAVFTERFMKKR
ncbi:outer membrane lipoprotein-sorting protein [Oceanithermus sp.]|nr:outer membrane lipoprotein-sorting protein [Oceanithermus sp.]